MSSGISQKAFFGIKEAGTWHTGVQLTAKKGIKTEEFGPLAPTQEIIQDESHGMAWPERIDLGRKTVDLTFAGSLRYSNAHWTHVAMLIGDDSGALATGVYTHTMDIQDETAFFYTGAGLIDDQVYEWTSVKPVSMEIATGGDGFMTFTMAGIADDILIAGDATNTSTQIKTTADYESESNRVPFGHARVRITNQDSGTSLDSSDEVCPSAITISFSRPYERDFVACRGTSTTQEWETEAPKENGLRSDVILTLEFPELTTDDYIENFQDAQAKKAEINFISTASTREIKFEFPNLYPLVPDVNVSGISRIPQVISYQALAVASGTGPTGMTGVSKPFRLTLVNTTGTKDYITGTTIS